MTLKAPYPWFGGKSNIMREVWKWLGDTPNFVDPFLGSGTSVLGRPPFGDALSPLKRGSFLGDALPNGTR